MYTFVYDVKTAAHSTSITALVDDCGAHENVGAIPAV